MDEMDVLGYLKSRQNELERVNHPFSGRSVAFRYLYSFGVGILALGSMKSITELQEQYEYFLECISLPKEQRQRILPDLNNRFEFRLTECMKILRTKEVQYCFMADLYKLYNLAMWSLEYCTKVIENFVQIFHMSENEIAFFKSFNRAAVQRDLEEAQRIYREFQREGLDISYETLQYFYPEFEEKDTYGDVVVSLGKTLIIDKPTVIQGNIRVERGGSLLFRRADVRMSGSIFVDGGRIQVQNTKMLIEKCDVPVFLYIKDAAVVRVENSAIDCNFCCGFLRQNSGRLFIEESEFSHSEGRRMIFFSGIDARIMHSSFIQGRQGFLKLSGSARLEMTQCDFSDCYEEYGGGIFSDSVDHVVIQECSFRNCQAKYLGAAIYFKYQKLGQVVKDCVFRMCVPEENQVFNSYSDDFLPKVRSH